MCSIEWLCFRRPRVTRNPPNHCNFCISRRFLLRDAMVRAVYAVVVCLSVCMYVCLCVCVSVTLRYSIKTAKRRITQITPYDSPGSLVF